MMLRANGLRNNTKVYSTTTNAVNRSKPTCFRQPHTLLGDSIFVTALTLGLVFGMIQPTTPSIITSNYSGILSSSSPKFARPGGNTDYYYCYQAIQVTVYTSGIYNFTSSSSMDTYGYFYNSPFNPSSPSHSLITSDDDSGGGNGQFQIRSSLQFGRTYVLVVTTYNNADRGSFSIRATGPASVGLISITSIATTFSGILSLNSPMFFRPNGNPNYYYYYQAIQVTVYTTAMYNFTSNSTVDTYGCLYYVPFNPSYPSQSLITSDDDSGGSRQFKISHRLQSGHTYVLIVTTYNGRVRGSFSITAVGPASVGLTAITPSATTTSPVISLTYSGILSSNSPMFSRVYGKTRKYYYQAIRVTVYTTGTYNFTSSSSIDTYGYFYNVPFDPSYPSQNLITSDDDSGGNQQFQIRINLQSGHKYVLVVTTYGSSVTGSFSVRVTGPASVDLTSITPPKRYDNSQTLTIVGVTFGCVLLLIVIFGICTHRQKRNRMSNPKTISSRRDQSVQAQNVPMANIHRNAPRPNGNHVPYTISMSAASLTREEELPPSYETFISSSITQEQGNSNRY